MGSTHFSRLLRHAWATVGLFFSPVTTRGRLYYCMHDNIIYVTESFFPWNSFALRRWSNLKILNPKGVKVKVKFPLCLNSAPRHEGILGEWRYSSTHSDLDIRWRWVVIFTPRPLYPQGKVPWYPLDRRLGGPQSRSGGGDEEKNPRPLPGLEPPIIQPVA
jgi:hypothetical protein